MNCCFEIAPEARYHGEWKSTYAVCMQKSTPLKTNQKVIGIAASVMLVIHLRNSHPGAASAVALR